MRGIQTLPKNSPFGLYQCEDITQEANASLFSDQTLSTMSTALLRTKGRNH